MNIKPIAFSAAHQPTPAFGGKTKDTKTDNSRQVLGVKYVKNPQEQDLITLLRSYTADVDRRKNQTNQN